MKNLTGAYCVQKCLTGVLFIIELASKCAVSLHSCPSTCICASDLLSCVSQNLQQLPAPIPAMAATLDLSHNALYQLQNHWLAGLPRIQILRLSHNHISRIAPQAFHNATYLMHLDLSSNRLHVIEKQVFHELISLQELLLYNNQIVRVDGRAFIHLGSLRKLYLSWNLLMDFPFSSIQELHHPHLRILDLSSNKLPTIPIAEVTELPLYVKNGLFLHDNPFMCDCTLYAMFRHWEKYGLNSVQDFREEHTCLAVGQPQSSIRFFKHYNIFENCSLVHGLMAFPITTIKAVIGEPLLISCETSLQDEHTSYMWTLPSHELIRFPGNINQTMAMYSNGSLEIKEVRQQDSGIYVCKANNKHLMRNETREVNVTVHYKKSEGESFNTGLTTLLGCAVSLVLVLMYLYLTPCHCCCRKKVPTPSPPHECSAQSSILSATPPATDGPNRKISGSRHVVFLEPVKETRNGKAKLATSEDFTDAKNPKIQQMKSDSESITSVFSDSPIMP
ncbi:amphoterin-induced protein 3 [Protopterus annectens]|uniref:amphoterin-induced protein 3 n=1 Tax=Protopterus annectens TaxID=7888 RepID=UPI001CFA1CA3|nr:amphoterin-induced protein 3 [Protopterus annectens]